MDADNFIFLQLANLKKKLKRTQVGILYHRDLSVLLHFWFHVMLLCQKLDYFVRVLSGGRVAAYKDDPK